MSITQLGAARDTGNIDRLVVRRRIDVAARRQLVDTARCWWASPRAPIASTPAASGAPSTDQIGTDVDRRDLFTASEVLELTAPAATDNFDVTPPFAPPGTALTVLISGSRRCPASTAGGPSR